MTSPIVPSKRRAPYTNIACNNCRRRRCKCDGVHPVCGTCSFYGHECNWNQDDVSQRPATKQLVQSLQMRIRELEYERTKLGVGPIGGSGGETNQEIQSAMSLVDPARNTDENEENFPRGSHLTLREGSISASGPTSMWSTFLNEPVPLRESKLPHPGLTYRYTFQQTPSLPLHMQPQDIQMSEQCEWDRYLPKLNTGFTRLEHDTLLHRCFNYHTLWLRTLEPDLFLRDMLLELIPDPDNADLTKSSEGLTYYSPFLHCALMSLATTFSIDSVIRSKHVRDQFARHAKQLLESECEQPTLTAVHGLVFLSEYHGSLGERGLAYLYLGMSCRMVRALGLCINGVPMVESGAITQQELVSRTWLFWALFCQDKLMSLEYGRDYDLSLPHLDVELPTVDLTRDQHPWEEIPHGGSREHSSRPNQSTLVFFQGCRLMLIAIRIMDTVYSQGRQQFIAMENDSVANIHKLLDNWYHDLPNQIRVPSQSGAPPLPHVIVLNITYWWLLMLLHRPFSFRTEEPPPHSSSWPTPTAFTDSSVDICEQAGRNIVQLVVLFDQNYGCRFFPLNMLQTIFVAGATFLGICATLPDTASRQRTDAHTMTRECIRTLRAAAQTWEPARLYASRLEGILNEQALWSSFNSRNQSGGVYKPAAPEHDDTVSRMFRDFTVQHDQDAEELGIPLITTQYQHPPSQRLNQEPHLGVPPRSEFIMDSDPPLLPFSLFLDEGEFAGDVEHSPSEAGIK